VPAPIGRKKYEVRIMARLIFIGTAAALPRADRANTMLAVFGQDGAPGVLVDCGSGVYDALLRADLAPNAVGDLYISHAHIDHLGGLPSLIESFRLGGRTTPLHIWAIPEVLSKARGLVDLFSYELTLDSWAFPVHFHEADERTSITLGGLPARLARMQHTVPCGGLRFTLPGGDLVYTSDTQPHAGLASFARGAHLLITECTFPYTAVTSARASKHMTALEAGQLATECGVRELAVVHLGVGPDFDPAQVRAEIARAFSGRIHVPHDGEALEV
jgi:ribonuclease BN (tRNA processing enzyme)